jgi:hypothetical protein
MGIKPAKRRFAKMFEPAYYSVALGVVTRGEYDDSISSWKIRVKRNGSWDFGANDRRQYFPTSLPADAAEQLRQSFTNALSRRAEGWPEPHSQ